MGAYADDLEHVVRVLEARIALDGGRGAMGEPLGVAPLLVEAYAGLRRPGRRGARGDRRDRGAALDTQWYRC